MTDKDVRKTDHTVAIHSINDILQYAHYQHASDVHLSSGMPVMIRVDGDMLKLDTPVLDHTQVQLLIYATMSAQQQKTYTDYLELDYAFSLPNMIRFRINAFHQNLGAAAVFRIIPSEIMSLEALDLDNRIQHKISEKPATQNSATQNYRSQHTLTTTPNAPNAKKNTLQKIANLTHGLVLITGPTGSGKSTTLAALIDYINTTRNAHILTIEDPIEFIHTSNQSLINQREVNKHTSSFDIALRSALREDPDVILIGELRDISTIRLALTAAETGHLVFATLHTSSAIKTIDRIIDVFPANEKPMIRAMLSESLRAVISQILIKQTTSGRVAAHEIMIATPAIRHLIRQNKLAQIYSAIQTGANLGMLTLDASISNLLQHNLISKDNAQRYAKQADNFS